jgi:hypothetical protein
MTRIVQSPPSELERLAIGVATEYGVPPEIITLPAGRTVCDGHLRRLAVATAVRLARLRTDASDAAIGRAFGRRRPEAIAATLRWAEGQASSSARFAERLDRCAGLLDAWGLTDSAPTVAPRKPPPRTQLAIRPRIAARLERIARLATADVGLAPEALTLPAWHTRDVRPSDRTTALRLASWLALEHAGASANEAARVFGIRQPGQVRRAYGAAVRLVATKPAFAERVRRLARQLAGKAAPAGAEPAATAGALP